MRGLLRRAVRSLRFDGDYRGELGGISRADWAQFTELVQQSHLTLPLAVRCREAMPDPEPWDRVIEKNAARNRAAREVCAEIAENLTAAGIGHLFLKGLTHWPGYADRGAHRPQYDVDVYCPAGEIAVAWEILRGLGYQPLHAEEDARADHRPGLIRPTQWRWRGDYFDPEMPLIVELHHRFWDPATEHFDLDSAGFYGRRRVREIEGLPLTVLDPVDQLRYSAWHLLRHLLRGDLRLYHAYEVAHFLDRTAEDEAFWAGWTGEGLVAETMVFRLVQRWFGCRMNAAAKRALPVGMSRWIDTFSDSPLNRLEKPNKDELFLHFEFVHEAAARRDIARRRLLPSKAPKLLLDDHNATPGRRLRRAVFTLSRAGHHLAAGAGLVRSAARWLT